LVADAIFWRERAIKESASVRENVRVHSGLAKAVKMRRFGFPKVVAGITDAPKIKQLAVWFHRARFGSDFRNIVKRMELARHFPPAIFPVANRVEKRRDQTKRREKSEPFPCPTKPRQLLALE
jgi:hypothetical protein